MRFVNILLDLQVEKKERILIPFEWPHAVVVNAGVDVVVVVMRLSEVNKNIWGSSINILVPVS
jgi:hypothetical protein